MPKSFLPVWWTLAFLSVGLFLYVRQERQVTSARVGFPLDDSWIHLQIARNVATGHGFSYNPDEPTPGSTAPLWTLLLACGRMVGLSLPLAAKLMGGVLSAGCAILVVTLLRREGWPDSLALLAGLLASASFPVLWSALSGLEIPLVSFLLLLSCVGLCRKDKAPGWKSFIPLALASQARPEAGLLFVLSWALLHLPGILQKRKSLKEACLPLILLTVVAAPYVLFCLKTTGRPLPDTFYAKTGTSRIAWPSASYLIGAYSVFWKEHFLLGLFFPLGFLSVWRDRDHLFSRMAALWTIGLPLGYSVLDKNVHFMGAGIFGRYFFPLFPFFVVTGLAGARFALETVRGQKHWRILWPLFLLFSVPRFFLSGPAFYRQNVSDIQAMQVKIGDWIKVSTPEKAVIATNDIGAVAYLGQRRILDLAGLVNPEIGRRLEKTGPEQGPFGEGTVMEYVREKRPDYIVLFPNWYPRLAASSDYEEAYRVEKPDNITSGGPVMMVLKRKEG